MKINCLIIDDEPLAIEIIESYCVKIQNISIVGKCESAVNAFQYLKQKRIDLMFLDIHMPDITGLEFLKTINNPPKVILTTAYRKYALDGFELNVIDYLLKPISFDRFLKAIDKYYELSGVMRQDGYLANNSEKSNYENYLYVKEDRKMVKVDYCNILYIESMKDYSVIHTTSKKVITKIPISVLEKKLPEDKFLRIHRSYIISTSKIDAFTPVSIEIGKKELTIGRNYKIGVLNKLSNNI